MASTSPWSGTVLVVLWVCGVAYSWLSCGLIGDGSYYLLDAVTVGPYKDVGHERAVPNLLAQLPLAAAIAAGVTDLHWLARLQSLGWFALPAILYSLAVLRTRREPCAAGLRRRRDRHRLHDELLPDRGRACDGLCHRNDGGGVARDGQAAAGGRRRRPARAGRAVDAEPRGVRLSRALAGGDDGLGRAARARPLCCRGGDISRGGGGLRWSRQSWPGAPSRHSRTRPTSRRRHPKPGISGRIRRSISRPLPPSSSRALCWCGRPISRPRAPGFSSLPCCSRWCCCRCLS